MNILKKGLMITMNLIVVLSFFTCTYATGNAKIDETAVVRNILNSGLNILSWFAYAVALGAVIFIGIRYAMSGANERANLKGVLPRYLIGIALVVMCFTIAQAVSNIAGNDSAEEIINVGAGSTSNLGNLLPNEETDGPQGGNGALTYGVVSKKGGNLVINYAGNVEPEVVDKVGEDPVVYAPPMVNGMGFDYWEVERTHNVNGMGFTETIEINSTRFEATGCDTTWPWETPEYSYKLTPHYKLPESK